MHSHAGAWEREKKQAGIAEWRATFHGISRSHVPAWECIVNLIEFGDLFFAECLIYPTISWRCHEMMPSVTGH